MESNNQRRGRMDVIIIGGSLAGLMHGVMLKRAGHNVRILEKSPTSIRHGEAAGIRAGPQVREFFSRYDLTQQPYYLPCPGLQFIDEKSNYTRFIKSPMSMTGWTTLYFRLRANFDGFESDFVPSPPASLPADGTATYELGQRVTDVVYKANEVTLTVEDSINGGHSLETADLVVAADGHNSAMRSLLLPALSRPKASYVAWRGSVPESSLSQSTLDICKDNFTVLKMPRNYILVYRVPGPSGSLAPGTCLLNWVWYYNCPPSSAEHAEILTDAVGHTHHNTLPPGGMRPEIWARQCAYARHVLGDTPFQELVAKTREPFISSVSDALCSQAAFFEGKLLIVGDALALFRPHVALSANQAARCALQLERALRGEIGLGEWERGVLQYGRETRQLSVLVGNWTQIGLLAALFSAVKYLWIRVIGVVRLF